MRLLVSVGALLLCACDADPATVLNCGANTVNAGENSFDLTQRCGQPATVEQAQGRPIATPVYDSSTSRYVIKSVPQPYEIWTYNFGPTLLMARLSIKNGTITKIEAGGYGH